MFTSSVIDSRPNSGFSLSGSNPVAASVAPRSTASSARWRRWMRLIGAGEGIHWPDLDEDLSVAGLLQGRPSGESQESLARWLAQRSG
jgi:hypothetical protein